MDTAYALKGHTLASIVQAGDPVQGGRSAGQGKRAADRRPPGASPSTGAGWASRAMSFILMAPRAIAAASDSSTIPRRGNP
jgi:hypothetical protein